MKACQPFLVMIGLAFHMPLPVTAQSFATLDIFGIASMEIPTSYEVLKSESRPSLSPGAPVKVRIIRQYGHTWELILSYIPLQTPNPSQKWLAMPKARTYKEGLEGKGFKVQILQPDTFDTEAMKATFLARVSFGSMQKSRPSVTHRVTAILGRHGIFVIDWSALDQNFRATDLACRQMLLTFAIIPSERPLPFGGRRRSVDRKPLTFNWILGPGRVAIANAATIQIPAGCLYVPSPGLLTNNSTKNASKFNLPLGTIRCLHGAWTLSVYKTPEVTSGIDEALLFFAPGSVAAQFKRVSEARNQAPSIIENGRFDPRTDSLTFVVKLGLPVPSMHRVTIFYGRHIALITELVSTVDNFTSAERQSKVIIGTLTFLSKEAPFHIGRLLVRLREHFLQLWRPALLGLFAGIGLAFLFNFRERKRDALEWSGVAAEGRT
ncbi:MAG: hypothetical protein WA324_11845 [Bryobacteraceae bacterium]